MTGRPMLHDLTGKKFGRLLVVNKSTKQLTSGHFLWECLCSCGNTKFVKTSHLIEGRISSCGCFKHDEFIKRFSTHGLSKSPTYSSWCAMIKRCSNPNILQWGDYGGRGIKVCEDWLKYENFYRDMGDKPKGTSLDRLDVNVGYSKDNCVWSTFKTQSRNTRRNIRVEFNGKTQVLSAWCEELNLNYKMVYPKLKKGLPLDKVFQRI